MFYGIPPWEAMSTVNNNSAPLPDTTKSQQYMLFAVAGMVLLTLIYLLLIIPNARNAEELFFDLLLVGIAIGAQLYYIKRIRSDWQTMTKERRWQTGIAALIIPPVVAVVGTFLAAIAFPILIIALILRAIFGSRSIGGRSIGFGSIGFRSNGANAWTPNFGSYWGNERVIQGSDGQPLWVGSDEVKYGSNGKPIWVGDREVKYGADGRPAWTGDDRVIFGSDRQSPEWIGDRKVSR